MANTPVAITLDKSKPYSTVHGDRTQEDPHYVVVYEQGGLPFDADGNLVPDDGKTAPWTGIMEGEEGKQYKTFYRPLYDAKRRELLAKKITRLTRMASKSAIIEPDEDPQEEPLPEEADDINLVAWLQGKNKYLPFQIFKACRQRYSRNHTSLRSVIEDLVLDENLVSEENLAPALRKYLPQSVSAA